MKHMHLKMSDITPQKNLILQKPKLLRNVTLRCIRVPLLHPLAIMRRISINISFIYLSEHNICKSERFEGEYYGSRQKHDLKQ